MDKKHIPAVFLQLQTEGYIKESDILSTQDGFFLLYKSMSDILSVRDIYDFSGSGGKRLLCANFFDDWFLYAVPNGSGDTYSLLKLREQEHDAGNGAAADGDMPGVTISFISFSCEILLECLADPTDENRTRLDHEINRVVARRGQHHHDALKRYFVDPKSEAAYLVAAVYTGHIASYAVDGALCVPRHYGEIAKQYVACKTAAKQSRLPRFIESLNEKAGRVICDHEKIYIENPDKPTAYEAAAILATHTGNTSLHSFAAEVEYHAKFLTPLAKIKIPFFGRSIYDSAIRADMSVGDAEFQGPAPFYHPESKIVKRHCQLHQQMKI